MDSGSPGIDRSRARNVLWRGFLRLLHIVFETVQMLCKTQHNVGDLYRPLETGSRVVRREMHNATEPHRQPNGVALRSRLHRRLL